MDQSIPKLSIIVPCYNTEDTVGACISSLLGQTLKDIEIICVNDGSTDGTLRVLRGLSCQGEGRIRIIDQPNLGTWAARQHGIEASKGEFVGFVDADDTAQSRLAEVLWSTAVRSGADIVVCGYRRIDQATGVTISEELCHDEPRFVVREDPGCILGVNTAVWNKAYRATLLKGMASLPNAPRALEDVCINLLAYLRATGPVVHAPEPLVNYQVHANSTVTSVTPEVLQQDRAALLDVRHAYEDSDADVRLLAALDAAAFEHLGVSMAFRLSGAADVDLGGYLEATTAFLDAHFPTWRRSPYMKVGYARDHNAAIKRLAAAHRLYLSHLMGPSLCLYRFAIERLGIDIKW